MSPHTRRYRDRPCARHERRTPCATAIALLMGLSMLIACPPLPAQSAFPDEPPLPPVPDAASGYPGQGPGFSDRRCAGGTGYFVPGCGASARMSFPAGCYRPCDSGQAACPAHQACRSVLVDPCHDSHCMACGTTRSLCIDRP